MSFINLSFYHFLDLPKDELPALRSELLALCTRLELKGTILLAPEGINGFLAGARASIDAFKRAIAAMPRFERAAPLFPYKESPSDHQPFNRMLVRLKKEIITMGRPDVKPSDFTGPRVTAEEFRRWLDQGRELVVLDTRNDYEVRLGTFEKALDLKLKTFRQFPTRVRELAESNPGIKELPVVSFCTGGIRCEKASALLLKEGFKEVYQLDGGILRYFEKEGGAHYNGECFVFDTRVAVDAALKETGAVLCYNCQNPVSVAEQARAEYVYEKSCPHCFGRPKEHKERIAAELQSHSL